MVTAYRRSGRLDRVALLALLLLATVDRIWSQEPLPCPEGYTRHQLQNLGDPFFNYTLRHNQFNYPPVVWSLGILGSTNFITLRGKDSYLVKSASGDDYLLKEACVETKQVRIVEFTAVLHDDTTVKEKIEPAKKGDYTQTCMQTIPPEGLDVSRVIFKFRTTKGRLYEHEEQNYFQVRNLFVIGCFQAFK